MSEEFSSIDTHDCLNAVKLVIWDLDETFWTGTLSEGPITYRDSNVALVKRLAERGIVSSICSKNDYDQAKRVLEDAGIWDFFVLPMIDWAPKGESIKRLIEAANLRAENVLFVDDNIGNLQEAMFCSPGLMCLSDVDELNGLLDSPAFAGQPDASRTRLAHYKVIEEREQTKQKSGVSNVEFLRQSDIQVAISYEVDEHWDRIVELLNRANQLNFTKSRADTVESRETLRTQLTAFGFKPGVVHVRDRYGDSGMVGFFLVLSTLRSRVLKHFTFSCRILNLGIEQYVYEYLNEPELTIAEPVANPVKSFDYVDWIREADPGTGLSDLKQKRLLLVGGCDMLQLSSYCSCESVEFTNRPFGELMTRMDDPSLFLGDADKIRESMIRSKIPVCRAEDVIALDDELGVTDGVVLSLYPMTTPSYFRGRDGLEVRLHPNSIRQLLASEIGFWFVQHFSYLNLDLDQRIRFIADCVESVVIRTTPETPVILIGQRCSSKFDSESAIARKIRFNDQLQALSETCPAVDWLDLNQIVPEAWMVDGVHYHRQAYLQIAQCVQQRIGQA